MIWDQKQRRLVAALLVAMAVCLGTGLCVGQEPRPLMRVVYDPWPAVAATGGTIHDWILDPLALAADDAPFPGPDKTNSQVPWMRPGERLVLPERVDRPRDLAADPLIRRWLWIHGGPVADDPRYPQLLEIWGGGASGAIEHSRHLREHPPVWAKDWPTWRTRGWLPWGDGDAPLHYDAAMWWLQAAAAGSDAAWRAYLEQVAHTLSVGMDWRRGALRYEKGTGFTGDFYPPERDVWSHRWPAAIICAAHLAHWAPDDAAVQAVPLLARSMIETAPPIQARWGVRHIAHYLRSVRAMHLFAPHALPDASTRARSYATGIIGAAKEVDGHPAYWVNDGANPPTIEAWQDWLLISELAEWAVIWGDGELLEALSHMVRWHIDHTTDTHDPEVIHVGYKLELPGPWPMDARSTTPIHTTYAIPILAALAHLDPKWEPLHRRAWEGVMRELERVGFEAAPSALGGAISGGPKQTRRAPHGLRPDLMPRRVR